jgi:hypothetical protein
VLGHDLAIPAALARFRPDIKVVAVQLDPLLASMSVVALSSDFSLLPPAFSLIISDPASFLRTIQDTFDCIILTDAAPSSLGASRLFSSEFYQLCRSHLAAGGLIATAGPGNPTSLSPDATRILSTRVRTLRASFEQVLPVAADFPLLLASDHPLDVSTESLLVRLARLSEPPKLLDSAYAVGLLDPFRQEALSSALGPGATHAETGISCATYPRELFLNMVRENRLASRTLGALYARLGNLSPRLLLLLGAALLVVGLIGAFSRGHQFSRGFAIATSGFSGAAVSSLLLFVWQVRFGSVFSGVTLLVAAFMLGTVLGGILGSRSSFLVLGSWFFFAADLALAVCAAAAALLIHGGPTGAFLAANCVAGACLGFQFAVAGSAAANRHSPIAIRQSAGVLTALDLAGGSLGGILTALVIVPVFGIGTAALFAGAVKLTSALAQLMSGRPVSHP